MNQHIKTSLGTAILVIFAVTAGVFVMKIDKEAVFQAPAMPTTPSPAPADRQMSKQPKVCTQDVKLCPDGKTYVSRTGPSCKFAACPFAGIPSGTKFDACDKLGKYQDSGWWKDFESKAGELPFYGPDYIKNEWLSRRENESDKDPEKLLALEKYGQLDKFNRRVSLDAEELENGEGCLSLDGKWFIAALGGEYMGGGSYVLAYSTEGGQLDIARRTNQKDEVGGFWIDPPTSFGKRIGNVIYMTGITGDAGSVLKSNYSYDYVKNEIIKTKRCFGGDSGFTCEKVQN